MFELQGWSRRAAQLLTVLAYASMPVSGNRVWDDDYSFGHVTPFSHDGSTIPSFIITGTPKIFSDRLLLTPPVTGNQRTALWTTKANRNTEWDLEFRFRASGPERAGGSLHIWYTKESTGTSTVYSAKPFEGLALVVDSFGGKGGSLRGFLNDGTTDYSLHHQPQSLAFGHCDLPYRNLGIITNIKVSYTVKGGLKVMTNDKVCFESNKIKLPSGYRYGLSAASADSPDSFEIFAYTIAGTGSGTPPPPRHIQEQQEQDRRQQQQQQQQQGKGQSNNNDNNNNNNNNNNRFEFRDSQYGNYKTQDEQFRDVHERLQALTHQIAEVQRVSGTVLWKLDQLATEIQQINDKTSKGPSQQHVENLNLKIAGVDRQIGALEKTIKDQNVVGKIENLHNVVRDHGSKLEYGLPEQLKEALTTHGPRMSGAVTVLIVFQVMLAIAYVVYKRRRSTAPKKYL